MSDVTRFKFSGTFYAVGHGLFTSGRLIRSSDRQMFHWVFDCGSLSKREYLEIAYGFCEQCLHCRTVQNENGKGAQRSANRNDKAIYNRDEKAKSIVL
jgi:hypothetical protein